MTSFSFSQEFQAEKALNALKKVLPAQAKVYRSGILQTIPARELVNGDVIQLEEGDRISADARLVAAYSQENLYKSIVMPVPCAPAQSYQCGMVRLYCTQGKTPYKKKLDPQKSLTWCWQEIGDPTEAALLVAAIKAGLEPDALQSQSPRLREVPFDSRRRLSFWSDKHLEK